MTKTITASSGITKPAPAALNSANHEIKDGVPDGPLQVAQQDSGNDGTTEAPKLGPHKKRPHTGIMATFTFTVPVITLAAVRPLNAAIDQRVAACLPPCFVPAVTTDQGVPLGSSGVCSPVHYAG